MTQRLVPTNNFYFSTGESANFDITYEGSIIESKDSKSIYSFANITLGLALAFTVFAAEPSESKVTQTVEDIRFDQFNIRNENNVNHTEELSQVDSNIRSIEWNNNHLEVEELADKVTQVQIDEIKAHFDTKIEAIDKKFDTFERIIDSKFKESEQRTINEISEQIKNLKDERKNMLKYIIDKFVIPIIMIIITTSITIYLTNQFGK